MGKNNFSVKKFKLLPKRNWLTVLQLEQYLFCIPINYLQGLTFKAGELNQFSYAPNQEKYGWDERIMWVCETTIQAKSKVAKC
jgi:hypothetical protein